MKAINIFKLASVSRKKQELLIILNGQNEVIKTFLKKLILKLQISLTELL